MRRSLGLVLSVRELVCPHNARRARIFNPSKGVRMKLHIGPLPLDPVTRARIARSNRLGFPTITADAYAALVRDGIDPQNLTPEKVAQQYAQAREDCDLV